MHYKKKKKGENEKIQKYFKVILFPFSSIEDNAYFKLGGEAFTLFVYMFVSIALNKLGGVSLFLFGDYLIVVLRNGRSLLHF